MTDVVSSPIGFELNIKALGKASPPRLHPRSSSFFRQLRGHAENGCELYLLPFPAWLMCLCVRLFVIAVRAERVIPFPLSNH
jgi:hypothetical protein